MGFKPTAMILDTLMFTLFHFGFEIVKIAALAGVYSFVFYCFFFILREISGRRNLRRPKPRYFYLTIYALLFVYSFTYFGDHGLGDESHIPLGYFQTMDATDGYAFFTPQNSSQTLSVDSFQVKDHQLFIASANTYYIYNLSSGSMKKFDSKNVYEQYAVHNSHPPINHFKKYTELYWNGWRFWLLP